eukprot:scaffold38938_cov59-Attheya_sp.AAC.4
MGVYYVSEHKLKKVYLTVTNNPVPTDMHLQWMWAPQVARGKSGGPMCQLVSHTAPVSRRKARQYWTRCLLEVVKCEPITIQKSDAHAWIRSCRQATLPKHDSTCDGPQASRARAQLASLRSTHRSSGTHSTVPWRVILDKLEDEEGNIDDAIAKCKTPTVPIGLQAHAILFGGIRAKARTPWWGDGGLDQ